MFFSYGEVARYGNQPKNWFVAFKCSFSLWLKKRKHWNVLKKTKQLHLLALLWAPLSDLSWFRKGCQQYFHSPIWGPFIIVERNLLLGLGFMQSCWLISLGFLYFPWTPCFPLLFNLEIIGLVNKGGKQHRNWGVCFLPSFY